MELDYLQEELRMAKHKVISYSNMLERLEAKGCDTDNSDFYVEVVNRLLGWQATLVDIQLRIEEGDSEKQ